MLPGTLIPVKCLFCRVLVTRHYPSEGLPTVRQYIALGLFVGVVCLAGCQTFPRGGSDPSMTGAGADGVVTAAPTDNILPLSVQQRFSDIPLPADAREDLERTYVYESDRIQIGRMVYTSKSSVNDLAQFFIKECPVAGWQLGSVLQAEGAVLSFSKPTKRLDVRITPQGVGRSNLIVINMTPKEG